MWNLLLENIGKKYSTTPQHIPPCTLSEADIKRRKNCAEANRRSAEIAFARKMKLLKEMVGHKRQFFIDDALVLSSRSGTRLFLHKAAAQGYLVETKLESCLGSPYIWEWNDEKHG